jgi:crotonobetainyl-CoA:carnitine CoA-transferase CaiB-like acyl-CoA transferase
MLINQAHNAFATGEQPPRLGNAHPNIVPYETFATADTEIVVAIGSERQWPKLCAELDLAELATDVRFADNGARVRNRHVLRPILAARFAEADAEHWLRRLDEAGIPCAPVNSVLAAFKQPQAVARQMRVEVDHPTLGSVPQVGLPYKLSATPASIRSAPPLLGEHSAEVLDELGYSAAQIDALRAEGVI